MTVSTRNLSNDTARPHAISNQAQTKENFMEVGLCPTGHRVPITGSRTLSRRAMLVGTVSAAALPLLAACGAGASTPIETVPAATKPQGTVQFWHNWTTRTPLLRGYLDQFERENTGVKIEDTDVTGMAAGRRCPQQSSRARRRTCCISSWT